MQKAIIKCAIYSVCGAAALIFFVGCAAPIRNIEQQDLVAMNSQFLEAYRIELQALANKSKARLAAEYQEGDEQSYDILVLSGGGEYGAFGAGFLKGWGEVNVQGYHRPHFDSVSGISTGALIAPFAFVGTDSSYDRIVDLYRNPDKGMVKLRPLMSILSGTGSVYDATNLHKRIAAGIDEKLIQSIARGANENRVLIVGATNLDFGTLQVWDLANIAATSQATNAHPIIIEKLIASSAIPAVFPPVNINNLLYVDGGASMQVVSGINDRVWLHENLPTDLEFINKDAPIKIRIWVIVNNKLVMEPEVVRPTWSSIATRSLNALMRGSTLQTIQDTETFAHMIDQRPEFDVEMHYVAIPQEYNIPETTDLFDKYKMRGLVELGEKLGRSHLSWKTRALRPGAAILDIKN